MLASNKRLLLTLCSCVIRTAAQVQRNADFTFARFLVGAIQSKVLS